MQVLGKLFVEKVKFAYQMLLIAAIFENLTKRPGDVVIYEEETIYPSKRPGDQVVYEDVMIYDD